MGACMLSPLVAMPWSLSLSPKAHAALVDEEVSMRVFEAANQSVVSIVNYKPEGGVQVQDAVGTGVIWDRFGHIATNFHVISKVDKSSIRQSTKVVISDASGNQSTSYSVELVGSDSMHDIAVLRLVADDSLELQPMRFGRSAELKVGQDVFAIGNAYGLTKTLSAGIVSGLQRSIPSPVGTRIYGAIQTDASINAGNSGGPLLDSSGRMVGMNTATFTRSGTGRGSGVNFALPSDLLLEVVPSLIVYGNAMGKQV